MVFSTQSWIKFSYYKWVIFVHLKSSTFYDKFEHVCWCGNHNTRCSLVIVYYYIWRRYRPLSDERKIFDLLHGDDDGWTVELYLKPGLFGGISMYINDLIFVNAVIRDKFDAKLVIVRTLMKHIVKLFWAHSKLCNSYVRASSQPWYWLDPINRIFLVDYDIRVQFY